MKTLFVDKEGEPMAKDTLPVDTQIEVLYELMRNVIDERSIKAKL